MAQLEKDLGDPQIYSDRNRFLKAEQDYAAATKENQRLEKDYEAIFTKLMELEG
ncbi:hypothetical protein LL912_04705 [Niabella sp. CC-SYL272]|uniref:hypothetical protein n=1 Tax=Niabella agricola TaxID=2891571 RepID=UPI001F45E28F|nr:hypothetical protein [Niabella agricola]MCF3108072.1 hypothetical protein [Niabella agricola]